MTRFFCSVVELCITDPTGIATLFEAKAPASQAGDAGTHTLEFTTTAVSRTATAKDVTQVVRTFRLAGSGEDEVLQVDLAMAAVGQPLTHHLTSSLSRAASPLPPILAAEVKDRLRDFDFVIDVREVTIRGVGLLMNTCMASGGRV